MPDYVLSSIGLLAAGLTSLAYIPQLYKAWPRGATGDLSLNMLIVLWFGLLLWVVYGLLKPDWVVVLANSIGLVWRLAIADLTCNWPPIGNCETKPHERFDFASVLSSPNNRASTPQIPRLFGDGTLVLVGAVLVCKIRDLRAAEDSA